MGMDGLELAQEARKRLRQLNFIMMIGHAAEYSCSDIINAEPQTSLPGLSLFTSSRLESKGSRGNGR
jgi:hypothetical protein